MSSGIHAYVTNLSVIPSITAAINTSTSIQAQTIFNNNLPYTTGTIDYNNVIVSPIPVLQTGLPNLIDIIDNELNQKAIVSGQFSISGAGKITISVINNVIIISGAN